MKNRLKFNKCYLVGPMDHNREAGKTWRTQLEDLLIEKYGVIPLNPYKKPLHEYQNGLEDDDNYTARKQAIKDKNGEFAKSLMKPIVATDLRMVDHCDFIICYLDIDNKPCGTYDEIFMAADENKPVIIMCPQGVEQIPDWLWGRLMPQLFFDSWVNVQYYLDHIAFDEKIDDLGKWKFFDIEDIIYRIIENEDKVIYYR